jgi:predicted RNase H-like HicB family nuclease
MEYTAIIKEIEDGWYMGQCEQIPGAITQGQTIEEVNENLKEAIALVLESEREHFQKRYKGERIIRRKIAVV